MESQEFLSQAITILAASQDFPATISNLARLATSSICDWCVILAFENETGMRRLVPSEGLFPLDLQNPWGPGYVLRTGERQFVSDVSSDVIVSLGFHPGDPPFDSGRPPAACLTLPVIAGGRTIGAAAFAVG